MKQLFNPEYRTHLVSDERLKTFKSLTQAQRLKWVEELSQFLRLAKLKSIQKKQNRPSQGNTVQKQPN